MIAKTDTEKEKLRAAGKILAEVLKATALRAVAGVSTKELDSFAEEEIRARGAEPLFLNFDEDDAPYPYPATLCISVNDEVVHAIPGERVLQDGDVVSLDLGVLFEGYSADAAMTVIVGEGSADVRRLVEATRAALAQGIKAAHAGALMGDIGAAVSAIAKREGVSVVYDLGGHGTGRAQFHEEPFVPNIGTAGKGERLMAGMVLAIEPIFTLGSGAIVLGQDGWSYRTRDGGPSAHFEHTILVGERGSEILTA